MSKVELTIWDKATINAWTQQYGKVIEMIEKARQFKLGDFLVLYLQATQEGHDFKLQMNSYGAPVKYTVVAVTEQGIPFIKKVNKHGTPTGQLISIMGEESFKSWTAQKFEFRLDPDYADSLILDDTYDPAILHKTKQELFKAVTNHNKKHKVITSDLEELINFFNNNVNVGDVLWTSAKNSYIVHNKEIMTTVDYRRKTMNRIKGPFVPLITMIDKNSKTHKITPDFFYYKALYTERPRSYQELKI